MDEIISEKVDFWADVGKAIGFLVWIAVPLSITAISGFTTALVPFIIIGLFAFPLTFMCAFALSAICILRMKEKKSNKINKTDREQRTKVSEVNSFVKLCRGKK